MSYSYSRDRTAELWGDTDDNSEAFGPRRPSRSRTNNYAQPSSYPATSPLPPPVATHQDPNNGSIEMEPRPLPRLDTMEGFFHKVDSIKNEIGIVSDNVERIERLHTSALMSINEDKTRYISRDLMRLQNETQKHNMEVKDGIQELQLSNARLGSRSDAQIRQSQTAALKKRFLETIQRYQDVERMYEKKYRERVERQIRIVKPNATQDEVDYFIDSDDSPQVFAQSLMHASRTGQARAVLSEVQTRHDDIKRIEKTITELHQLFVDMSMLVEQQGEVLTQVEQNAETTVGQLQEGNTFVSKAIKNAKATRHKKWCCLVFAMMLCVMIAILVWWFGFGHPGTDANQK